MGTSRSGWVVRALSASAIVCAVAGFALSGDAVVAKALLDSGKKAVLAKKYEEAVPIFRKAVAEDPALVEAVYCRAQAHEKLKDDASALAAYREFLSLLAAKAAAGTASAEEQKLKPLAEKRVDALAVADREFQKLEEKYVADLLAIAKARVAADPSAALLAVNKVLLVAPKHAEALALRERLGVKKDDGPFAGIAAWRDLLGGKEFRSDKAKYEGDVMSVSIDTAGVLRPDPPATMGKDYAGEMEFRVVEATEQAWAVGFSLGQTKDSMLRVSVERAQVRLGFAKPKEKPEVIIAFAMSPLDLTAWHKVGVVVHGSQVQVFLDGETVIDTIQASRPDPSGDMGIWQQTCRSEIRVLRVGSFQ